MRSFLFWFFPLSPILVFLFPSSLPSHSFLSFSLYTHSLVILFLSLYLFFVSFPHSLCCNPFIAKSSLSLHDLGTRYNVQTKTVMPQIKEKITESTVQSPSPLSAPELQLYLGMLTEVKALFPGGGGGKQSPPSILPSCQVTATLIVWLILWHGFKILISSECCHTVKNYLILYQTNSKR